jgi:cytoplasmic iron level regulating protein YaaA (DUF328/UPF0246 family)
VLILLPPSEGKADPRRGRRLDVSQLSLPELAPARQRVLSELVALCRHPADARAVLGLGVTQDDEIARNTRLTHTPTAVAGAIYTGVLYDALGLATLRPTAKRRAARSLLIFSGLWGVLRIGDRIPAYRCPVGARLPGVGTLGAYWRTHLTGPVDALAAGGLVLDLRSGAYAATWSPAGPAADRVVSVRVLQERVVDGTPTRSVVSHFNKATKGRLVRDLLESGAGPRTPAALMMTLKDLGYQVEGDDARRLDVILPA